MADAEGDRMSRSTADRHPPPGLFDIGLRKLFEKRNMFDSHIREGGNVADTGCGPGYFTIHFSDVVGPGGKIYASDTNSRAVEILSRKVREKGIANIIVSADSASNLQSIPDASIDFLLSHLVICCMHDHAGAISEINRVLKKDGVAFISVTSFGMKGDRKHVSRSEWRQMLSKFNVLEEGRRLTSWWCLVGPLQQAESAHRASRGAGEVPKRDPQRS